MLIDYSTSRPSVSLLKSLGVTAVGRYIGWDSVPGFPSMGKNITKSEAAGYIAGGIDIFLAFEYAKDAAAKGASQGLADGRLAMSQLSENGAPPTMAVYFAVDFDLPDYAPSLPDTPKNALAKLGPVGKYFLAINNLKNPYEIGAYGGYYAVKRLLDALLVTKTWQTLAWSGGQVENRIDIFQNLAGPPFVGADIDVREHRATSADFGQWPRPGGTQPTPPPLPVPALSKENEMLHIKVTAPATGANWTGTRTFLYSVGTLPVHIVDGVTENAIAVVLPVVPVTWAQYQAWGGM